MVLTLRLEEVAVALEDMLEWSEFKFVFKGATSKVVSRCAVCVVSLFCFNGVITLICAVFILDYISTIVINGFVCFLVCLLY